MMLQRRLLPGSCLQCGVVVSECGELWGEVLRSCASCEAIVTVFFHETSSLFSFIYVCKVVLCCMNCHLHDEQFRIVMFRLCQMSMQAVYFVYFGC